MTECRAQIITTETSQICDQGATIFLLFQSSFGLLLSRGETKQVLHRSLRVPRYKKRLNATAIHSRYHGMFATNFHLS